MCIHLIEKSPLSSYFARFLRCLSPVFVAECPDATKIAFEKVLNKLFYSKTIAPTVADKARSGYRRFVTGAVKKVQRLN